MIIIIIIIIVIYSSLIYYLFIVKVKENCDKFYIPTKLVNMNYYYYLTHVILSLFFEFVSKKKCGERNRDYHSIPSTIIKIKEANNITIWLFFLYV